LKAATAALVAVAMALVVVAGCKKDEGGGADGGKVLKLAFITNNSSDFWTIARKGTEKAASELPNVEVDFRMPADGTAAAQRTIVDDLLAKGIDGIAISPVDPVNFTPTINEISARVPVLTQDSDAPESQRLAYVGTDNHAAGVQAGGLIKEALPNGGKIMLFVGKIDAQNAKERLQGIKDAIAGTNITIVDVRTDDTDTVRAKSNVADTLVKYPDIAGLVGLYSYNGPAILNAVKEAGKVGQVKIIAFDEDDQTLAGVKDGAIVGTIVQQPYQFGYQCVKVLAAVLKGDKSMIPADKRIVIPTLIIKQAEVDKFTEDIHKLRGR
jgi:ribose transport system substrate-binding protein